MNVQTNLRPPTRATKWLTSSSHLTTTIAIALRNLFKHSRTTSLSSCVELTKSYHSCSWIYSSPKPKKDSICYGHHEWHPQYLPTRMCGDNMTTIQTPWHPWDAKSKHMWYQAFMKHGPCIQPVDSMLVTHRFYWCLAKIKGCGIAICKVTIDVNDPEKENNAALCTAPLPLHHHCWLLCCFLCCSAQCDSTERRDMSIMMY